MDMKGVGLGKMSSVYGYVKSASGISQDHYPERLGKLYIINTPWGFSSAFNFVKGFLDPVTVAKIHVLGSGYKEELAAQIPPENLPKFLGGTCDCPGGCDYSDDGPWKDPKWVKEPKWAKKTPKDAVDTQKADTNLISDQPAAEPAEATKAPV